MEHFAKKKSCLREGTQPELFQGRGGFMELGHFDKHLIKKTRKKGPAGKDFRLFFS